MAAGDRVLLRPAADAPQNEGFIERVEPRHGTISRAVRGRQQMVVTNIDLLLIVASAAEPRLKPNLIDRLLVTAEKGRVRPVICINKIDLVDPAGLEPLGGVYSRMGYEVLLLSAKTGFGVERFARLLAGRESVLTGQSGVGKTSLLNAVDRGCTCRWAKSARRTRRAATPPPWPGCCRWPAAATWSIRRGCGSFGSGT